MKAVILNGARADDRATDSVNKLVTHELAQHGWQIEPFLLRDAKIAYCHGDFECWVKTPGVCKTPDDSRAIARAVIHSDLVVYLTPITFGGYSSELKRALDKMIGLVAPFFTQVNGEVHHEKRYARYPRLLGVGVMPQPDNESKQIFTTLVHRNAINLHAPAHAACVLASDANAAEMRAELGALFSKMGMRQ